MSQNKMSCCGILKFLSLESILKGWSFGCTSIYPEVFKRAMRWDSPVSFIWWWQGLTYWLDSSGNIILVPGTCLIFCLHRCHHSLHVLRATDNVMARAWNSHMSRRDLLIGAVEVKGCLTLFRVKVVIVWGIGGKVQGIGESEKDIFVLILFSLIRLFLKKNVFHYSKRFYCTAVRHPGFWLCSCRCVWKKSMGKSLLAKNLALV